MEITLEELKNRTEAIAPGIVHSNYDELHPAKEGQDQYWDQIVSVPDFDEIAFDGPVQFELNGWTSPVFENATHGFILFIFRTALKYTGDDHHVFFEGYATSKIAGGIITLVTLFAGS